LVFLQVREKTGRNGKVLDTVSYDLDIDFTTNSRLRALKVT